MLAALPNVFGKHLTAYPRSYSEVRAVFVIWWASVFSLTFWFQSKLNLVSLRRGKAFYIEKKTFLQSRF
jgi:hypothetical protein